MDGSGWVLAMERLGDSSLMVIDQCIPMREQHDQIYEKFEINKEEFNLKLSFYAKSRRTSGPSYVMVDEDLQAFCWAE